MHVMWGRFWLVFEETSLSALRDNNLRGMLLTRPAHAEVVWRGEYNLQRHEAKGATSTATATASSGTCRSACVHGVFGTARVERKAGDGATWTDVDGWIGLWG
eukprot:Opistho-2@58453